MKDTLLGAFSRMFMPQHTEVSMRGWVKHVSVPTPTLEHHGGDLDRLKGALRAQLGIEPVTVELQVARDLPPLLRASDSRLKVTLFQDQVQTVITSIDPVEGAAPVLGLALDLGTTRYVLQLVDLESGHILCASDHDNPQIAIGPDILTRVHFTDQHGGARELQSLLLEDLQGNIDALCRENGVDSSRICNVAVAGNTAMTHFFLGLPSRWLIREPYVPAVNVPGLCRASDVGLRLHPCARIYCFPNAGSYFGGDLFAGILFSGMDHSEEIAILVDVGTNAEVVLGNKDWLIGCAGAAGPALEGGVSAIGRRAEPGVIDKVRIDPETLDFEVRTIGGYPPEGICGSGFIDLAAELFRNGLLDSKGRLVPSRAPERLQHRGGVASLVIVPAEESGTRQSLRVGQPELDSLIRSKAAMYTILETLTATVGISFEEVERFYVAGTFGQFIDPESAITVGMLPDIPRGVFRTLGNSSVGGATRLLQDPGSLEVVSRTLEQLTYLELNVNQEFMNRFSAAIFLPHTDGDRFPSVSRAGARSSGQRPARHSGARLR